MKKLLLLAISMVSFLSKHYAADTRQQQGPLSRNLVLNDSSGVDDEELPDPKEGFKDLFEKTSTNSGFSTAKLNPKAVSFVEDYMDRHASNLNKMKSWGKPYFDMMNSVLAKYGLPIELKYLSVIESQLKSYAVSWAGAVGPWQFMPATARNMGLKVGRTVDERTDFYKSTHAAARYLTQLYALYGDWLLVIAAYNGGPGNVNAAIRKSGSRNFWDLQYHLPTESRNHVKKFIATHYIMEGEGGITTLTKKEAETIAWEGELVKAMPEEIKANEEVQTVSGKYTAAVIAQFIQMNLDAFNKLNPGFDRALAANGTYNLRLPSDKMLLFQANKPQILEQSIKLMLTMAGR